MSPYAEPRFIEDMKQCYFYHAINLPGVGTVQGDWDLRDNLDAYLGGFSFVGKRVLDVGCANGLLSFFMESKGAEVVSFDLDKNGAWDLVPFANWEHYETAARERRLQIDSLNNAYWLAHRLIKSKARAVFGNVYSIPESIGAVDVCVFGSILQHLRDPFLALQNGLRITRETVVVTDLLRAAPKQATLVNFLRQVIRSGGRFRRCLCLLLALSGLLRRADECPPFDQEADIVETTVQLAAKANASTNTLKVFACEIRESDELETFAAGRKSQQALSHRNNWRVRRESNS